MDIPHSVSVDVAGDIYVAGYFSTTCDFNPGPGVTSLTSAAGRDAYVARFTANGDLVWVRGFGGATNEDCFDVSVDLPGNVVAGGASTARWILIRAPGW